MCGKKHTSANEALFEGQSHKSPTTGVINGKDLGKQTTRTGFLFIHLICKASFGDNKC